MAMAPNEFVKTMLVKHKETGQEMIINKSDYDANIYEKIKASQKQEAAPAIVEEKESEEEKSSKRAKLK